MAILEVSAVEFGITKVRGIMHAPDAVVPEELPPLELSNVLAECSYHLGLLRFRLIGPYL